MKLRKEVLNWLNQHIQIKNNEGFAQKNSESSKDILKKYQTFTMFRVDN
jgi:hypothetical protein